MPLWTFLICTGGMSKIRRKPTGSKTLVFRKLTLLRHAVYKQQDSLHKTQTWNVWIFFSMSKCRMFPNPYQCLKLRPAPNSSLDSMEPFPCRQLPKISRCKATENPSCLRAVATSSFRQFNRKDEDAQTMHGMKFVLLNLRILRRTTSNSTANRNTQWQNALLTYSTYKTEIDNALVLAA